MMIQIAFTRLSYLLITSMYIQNETCFFAKNLFDLYDVLLSLQSFVKCFFILFLMYGILICIFAL